MALTSWELWTLISRWGVYVSMAASIGGACSLWLMKNHNAVSRHLLGYTLIATAVAIPMAVIHFLVRVGSVTETGIGGMFDLDMIAFMWDSPIGQALLLRAVGLSLLLSAVLFSIWLNRTTVQHNNLGYLKNLIVLIGILVAAFSFTEAGHSVGQTELFSLALTTHALLTLWWMGSLYPLWLACHRLSFNEAHPVLERFGQIAVAAVVLLVLGGLYMSYQLTCWINVLEHSYGVLLVTKVVLVVVILLLAAAHKFVLVPQLKDQSDTSKIKRSIVLEKTIGISIFAITTALTTLVGPLH